MIYPDKIFNGYGEKISEDAEQTYFFVKKRLYWGKRVVVRI
jgi:hypothetical protein